MDWTSATPPAPGVYRVREPRADVWYARWDGRGWCEGAETPAAATRSTARRKPPAAWCLDAKAAQHAAQAATARRTEQATELARHGLSRYAIAERLGVSHDNYAVRCAAAAAGVRANRATLTALWRWSERARSVSKSPFAGRGAGKMTP